MSERGKFWRFFSRGETNQNFPNLNSQAGDVRDESQGATDQYRRLIDEELNRQRQEELITQRLTIEQEYKKSAEREAARRNFIWVREISVPVMRRVNSDLLNGKARLLQGEINFSPAHTYDSGDKHYRFKSSPDSFSMVISLDFKKPVKNIYRSSGEAELHFSLDTYCIMPGLPRLNVNHRYLDIEAEHFANKESLLVAKRIEQAFSERVLDAYKNGFRV